MPTDLLRLFARLSRLSTAGCDLVPLSMFTVFPWVSSLSLKRQILYSLYVHQGKPKGGSLGCPPLPETWRRGGELYTSTSNYEEIEDPAFQASWVE